MLIGADILDQVMLGGRRSTTGADLHAWETIFGCSVRGRCQADWRAEEAPSDHLIQSAEEQQALEYFQSTHTREPEGRYVVKLPKRVSRRCSRDQAVRRYKQNECSLVHKGNWTAFDQVLREYEEMGHSEPIPAADLYKSPADSYYLPAHGVMKASNTTTKLRVVFDASAKSASGTSLNDMLLPGLNLYPLLTDILISFKMHPIGMSSDVSKMFREVGLHPEDRDLHRYIQGEVASGQLKDMRMTSVTFASHFLATQVLNQVAHDHQDEYPRAAQIVRSNCYVDDCLTGATTVKEAYEIRQDLNSLLSRAQMKLQVAD